MPLWSLKSQVTARAAASASKRRTLRPATSKISRAAAPAGGGRNGIDIAGAAGGGEGGPSAPLEAARHSVATPAIGGCPDSSTRPSGWTVTMFSYIAEGSSDPRTGLASESTTSRLRSEERRVGKEWRWGGAT